VKKRRIQALVNGVKAERRNNKEKKEGGINE